VFAEPDLEYRCDQAPIWHGDCHGNVDVLVVGDALAISCTRCKKAATACQSAPSKHVAVRQDCQHARMHAGNSLHKTWHRVHCLYLHFGWRYINERLGWDTRRIPAVADLFTQMLLLSKADSKL